jgi:hypothetical protein
VFASRPPIGRTSIARAFCEGDGDRLGVGAAVGECVGEWVGDFVG